MAQYSNKFLPNFSNHLKSVTYFLKFKLSMLKYSYFLYIQYIVQIYARIVKKHNCNNTQNRIIRALTFFFIKLQRFEFEN